MGTPARAAAHRPRRHDARGPDARERAGHARSARWVLDVGGPAAADPALDLVAAWHLLDDGPRRLLRDDLGRDDLEWERGKAWAFEQAMGLVWYYAETNPTMSRTGRRTLDRLLAEEPGA